MLGENVCESGPDPFEEFEDWLVDGKFGEWPNSSTINQQLTQQQQIRINSNKNLLNNQENWEEWCNRFEDALAGISLDEARVAKRGEYEFRLDGVKFESPNLNFSETQFPCSVNFSKTSFHESADFSNATFSGDASFYSANFGGHTLFKKTIFLGNVNFSNVSFSNELNKKNVYFSGAIFSGSTNFIAGKFSGGADFRNAEFHGNADFRKAEFSLEANFGEVQFLEISYFIKAKFSGNVYFNEAVFLGKADIAESKFLGNADFRYATFSGDVNFNDVEMKKTFHFDKLIAAPITMSASGLVVAGSFYINSHFRGEVNLERLEVAGTASFSGARFNVVPNLRDSKFDRPPEVAGMVVPAPKLKKDKWWHFARADDDKDVAKYRKLKAMALAANDHEKDGEFFSYEMLAKRGGETDTATGLIFNTTYHWLSDFGQSFILPLIWMLASFVGFAIAYDLVIGRMVSHAERMTFVWEHSFKNVVPLFTSLFKIAGRPDGHKTPYDEVFEKLNVDAVNSVMTLAFIQQFIGVVLLFLFLLALRNKFRLK